MTSIYFREIQNMTKKIPSSIWDFLVGTKFVIDLLIELMIWEPPPIGDWPDYRDVAHVQPRSDSCLFTFFKKWQLFVEIFEK